MQRFAVLSLATLASVLGAQANTVPGLNGRLSVVDSLTYWGRRGAANPAGEVGMSMLNTMCNPGSVNIPWNAAMAANHPKFGFLICRESGGRFVQISDYSFCKHAFTSTNSNGACGTCINPGTGSLMGVACSDTYGAGNNGDRTWLGAPNELNPWLGTWNPIGSYFDRGDPAVTGAAATDGVRSLVTSGFDVVKNRVTVTEANLLVAGASYFYGIHLMHEGEAAANRTDNLASRGFNPVWSGTTWSFNNNTVAQVWGSILQHWTGATVNSARNGNDDGTFYVAAKVTPIGGGVYHYEYAVHNADNNRGGAAFRVPVDPTGVVSNFGFRDIDTNTLNDWTAARVGSEVVFSSSAANPLNWNSIYNFSFDCNIAPSNAPVRIDEARIGAGLLDVTVLSQVPSGGLPLATVNTLGTPCGQTTCRTAAYEMFGTAAAFDLVGSRMGMTLTGGNYTIGSGTGVFAAAAGTPLTLTDDSETTITLPFTFPYPGGTTTSLAVCSNGFVSRSSNGTSFTPTEGAFMSGAPQWAAMWHDWNPSAGGQILVDSSASVVRITWNGVFSYGTTSPATFQYQFFPNGTVNIIWQSFTAAGNSVLTGYSPGGSAIDPGSIDLSVALPGTISLCAAPFAGISLTTATRPVLGTTFIMTSSSIPAGTPFASLTLSFSILNPPLDLTPAGMPGCFSHVTGGNNLLYVLPASSVATSIVLPVNASLTGLTFAGQTFSMSSGYNALGVIASNGLLMVLGPQ